MLLVAQYAMGISEDSLISETAKVFGLNYSGQEAKAVFSEILNRLVRNRNSSLMTMSLPLLNLYLFLLLELADRLMLL